MTKKKKQKYYLYYNVAKREGVFSKDETSWEKTRVRQDISLKEMKKTVKAICKAINEEMDAIGFERVSSDIHNGVSACGERQTVLNVFMRSPDLDICWHWYLAVSVDND